MLIQSQDVFLKNFVTRGLLLADSVGGLLGGRRKRGLIYIDEQLFAGGDALLNSRP